MSIFVRNRSIHEEIQNYKPTVLKSENRVFQSVAAAYSLMPWKSDSPLPVNQKFPDFEHSDRNLFRI
ncbi:hypothetical protein HOLDEFILI_02817 [Holdemania filiformis DSM 12042]|uniref:Uncharacterized protein n=1 Tax=Holdemania filiformis DSM 12042 TaxID=545696 RepID=B9YAG0_9FIRM|nr:hypothetical protein HOLDEFILI_02817 [Holdemania filiformis DSM 12042]